MTEYEIKVITFLEGIVDALEDIADKMERKDNPPEEVQVNPTETAKRRKRPLWSQEDVDQLNKYIDAGLSAKDIVAINKFPGRTEMAIYTKMYHLTQGGEE